MDWFVYVRMYVFMKHKLMYSKYWVRRQTRALCLGRSVFLDCRLLERCRHRNHCIGYRRLPEGTHRSECWELWLPLCICGFQNRHRCRHACEMESHLHPYGWTWPQGLLLQSGWCVCSSGFASATKQRASWYRRKRFLRKGSCQRMNPRRYRHGYST